MWFEATPGLPPKSEKTLSQKYPIHKRAGKVNQVVEYLPGKHEALSPNPSTAKKQGWE
jgi:hypothetical protein